MSLAEWIPTNPPPPRMYRSGGLLVGIEDRTGGVQKQYGPKVRQDRVGESRGVLCRITSKPYAAPRVLIAAIPADGAMAKAARL